MESVQINLRVDPEGFEGAFVEQVATNVYRLQDTPIIANYEDAPIHAGDVIEVEPLPDGTHQLVRIVERSPLRHFSWAVPRVFVESDEYRKFGAAVEAAGGNWEGTLGGLLWVHLPPDSRFDPEAERSSRIAAAKLNTPEV